MDSGDKDEFFVDDEEESGVEAANPHTHAEFMRPMQMTLLNEGPADFEGDLRLKLSPILLSPLRQYHGTRYQHATRRNKLMSSERLKERAARNLKSVANTAAKQESVGASFYCAECSEARGRGVSDDSTRAKGKIYLCQKVRQHDPNGSVNSATCSQIWHDLWHGGSSIPPRLKTIRVRAPAGCARRGASECDNLEGSESSAAETGSASSDTGAVKQRAFSILATLSAKARLGTEGCHENTSLNIVMFRIGGSRRIWSYSSATCEHARQTLHNLPVSQSARNRYNFWD
ncbi:hypothetical protein GQ600_2625 [Phytophthora cactorum]|nr:hypothetical protein GQ600_2625 [Phytophthora cactorum]